MFSLVDHLNGQLHNSEGTWRASCVVCLKVMCFLVQLDRSIKLVWKTSTVSGKKCGHAQKYLLFKIVYNLELLLKLSSFSLALPQKPRISNGSSVHCLKKKNYFFSSQCKSVLGRDVEDILVFYLMALLVICSCFPLRMCSRYSRLSVRVINSLVLCESLFYSSSLVYVFSSLGGVSTKSLSVPTAKQQHSDKIFPQALCFLCCISNFRSPEYLGKSSCSFFNVKLVKWG